MNKKKKVIIIIISILFFLTFLFLNLPLIITYTLPVYSNLVLKRKLSFENTFYNPFKGRLFIEKIVFSDKEKNVLFKINKLSIDIDLLKTFIFKPGLSSIIIDQPETYLIKKDNKISFLDYFEKNIVKKQSEYKLLFIVNNIRLLNGRIYLKENDNYTAILNDFTLIIPGINYENEFVPEIKGNIFNKKFDIKGISKKDKDSIFNIFSLNIKDFNLNEINTILPDYNNIHLLSGIINTNFTLTFKSHRFKPFAFEIKGGFDIKSLTLIDINSKSIILNNSDINVEIDSFDYILKKIQINIISVSNGELYLTDTFDYKNLINKKNIINSFYSKINAVKINNFKFVLNEKESDKSYFFTKFFISLKELIIDKDNAINFNFQIKADGLDNFNGIAFFNLKENKYLIDKVNIQNLNLLKFNKFIKYQFIKTGFIKNYTGNIEIRDDEFIFAGLFKINNLIIPLNNFNQEININDADIDIKYANLTKNEILFNNIIINSLDMPFKNNNYLKNLSCVILFDSKPVKFIVEKDSLMKIKKISFDSEIIFKKLNALFIKDKINLTLKIDEISALYKLFFDITNATAFKGSALINLKNIKIFDGEKTAIDILKITGDIKSFNYPDINIDINEIKVISPIINIAFDKNKKLYLGSSFDISKFKFGDSIKIDSTKNSDQIKEGFNKIKNKINFNSKNIIIDNGELNYSDSSLNEMFALNINNINANISNLTSNKNIDSLINIHGIINKENKFNLSANILKNSEIMGELNTEINNVNIFSPYFEYYISHLILKGILNLDSKFKISGNDIDMIINMNFKNLKLLKIDQNKFSIFSFVNIGDKIDKNQGQLKLKIPIKGKLYAPEVDFRKIFFKTFIDLIMNINN